MYGTLCRRLDALFGLYGRLLGLAQQKEPVLQANKDLDALRRFTQEEEILAAGAAKAERERMEIVRRIAEQLGCEPAGLTISALAAHAPPTEAKALVTSAQALTDVLKQLQAQNSINRQLLEMNLSFAAFLMDTLQQNGPGSLYGATGTETDSPAAGFRFLDSEI